MKKQQYTIVTCGEVDHAVDLILAVEYGLSRVNVIGIACVGVGSYDDLELDSVRHPGMTDSYCILVRC